MPTHNSPYSASFTAAGMMYSEMLVVVPMLLKSNDPQTINSLVEDSSLLKIKSVSARKRVMVEFTRRFGAVSPDFWTAFLGLPEAEQRLALFFVLLKTYPLLFHFQTSLALPKYSSIDRRLSARDVLFTLEELAAADPFVDSWTDLTRGKIASSFVTMLKQGGLIDLTTGELAQPQVPDDAFIPYVKSGDIWFLQTCFLPQYKVQQIKQLAL